MLDSKIKAIRIAEIFIFTCALLLVVIGTMLGDSFLAFPFGFLGFPFGSSLCVFWVFLFFLVVFPFEERGGGYPPFVR